MKTKLLLLSLLLSCVNENKKEENIDYSLTSVKSVTIDNRLFNCDVHATIDRSTKEIFSLAVYLKDKDGNRHTAFVTDYKDGRMVQIIGTNMRQPANLAVYNIENNKVVKKAEKAFKIRELESFIKTENSLYQKIDSAIKKR